MDQGKFQSEIEKINSLIQNNCTSDQLANFIDQGPQWLKEYLETNEDWSHLDYASMNPLSVAAWNGKTDILSLLLSKYGMAVNAQCEMETIWSINALTMAIVKNEVDCVRILLQQGANPEIGGIYFGTPFKNAAELDGLCRAKKINIWGVNSRDDSIKNLLLEEEEAVKRRGGEKESKKKAEMPNCPTKLF